MPTENNSAQPKPPLLIAGVLFLIAGVGGAFFFAFGISTSVDSGDSGPVTNISLVDQQLTFFIASVTVALAGLIMTLFSWLASKMNKT